MTIIDDAFNANPDSMRAGLETLKASYKDRPLILVLGDMRELGEESRAEHTNLGQFIAERIQPQRLFTVGDDAKLIAEKAETCGIAASFIDSVRGRIAPIGQCPGRISKSRRVF